MTPTQWEKIASLEKDLELTKNVRMATVDRIEKKIDWVDGKLDRFIDNCNKTYATKEELSFVKEEIANGNARKVAWIQQYGGIISWILGLVGVTIAVLLK